MTVTQIVDTRVRGGRLGTNALAIVALAFVVLVAIAVALAPVISPYGYNDQDLARFLEWPSADHLLGTDSLGRDILTRLLWGGQPTLLGVLVAVLTFVVVGVLLGIVAGTLGGWVDALISGIADILMSLPGVVLIFAVLAIFDQDLTPAMITLGFLGSGSLVRVVRATVLGVRGELFVSAAIVSGLGSVRLMARHILPAVVGPVVIQASLFAGAALAVQSGLGFLGLGVHPPLPTWGSMVGEAAANLAKAPWLLVVSGGIITLVSLALALIGDGLRDVDAARRRSDRGRAPIAARTSRADGGTPPEPSDAVLRVQDLEISFGDSPPVAVVRGVSFEVQPGEILGLVGESGSGKTVTTLATLGLLPGNAAITAGRILIGQDDVTELDDRGFAGIRGRRTGLISQEPMVALDPLFTVGSQLLEVLKYASDVPASQRRARAMQLLSLVHLPDPEAVMRRFPHELSGGMAQRVVIATALAGDPELLIADEPTTALDVTVQAGILDLLRELRRERGLAVLFVTHDLAVVADICDRVIVMEKGVIVESGLVDDLFADPREPYTRELIASTPRLVDGR
ncbi:dipeptide/oligopeptide/nickel ABC transporter permease/ATP-binding protein [Naasia lichenicola]|uniref:Dipeptide/oligopeptide/nickel ABC transporter permease/ATP-binding protein n=1 Tax=Naasia lichenicola TaxID=2565933 RepID=A0A4S4FP15_9MICO|nr:dipeptide/oligopeptide/nickel ABC transporter permease/ATP-binding protein [Naasia lichenicola]THG31582.1 dipeptide/oligopeptide/nickel ABC transporter permease/ATP-binding protein [Naasia lichenicola]